MIVDYSTAPPDLVLDVLCTCDTLTMLSEWGERLIQVPIILALFGVPAARY